MLRIGFSDTEAEHFAQEALMNVWRNAKSSRREPLKSIFGGGIARSAALADRFIWATQARIAPAAQNSLLPLRRFSESLPSWRGRPPCVPRTLEP